MALRVIAPQFLDRPIPAGYARWNGPLIAKALGDVDVQYVWRFLRTHKIDLAGSQELVVRRM